MMFSTKVLLLTILVALTSCGKTNGDIYDEECPFDWIDGSRIHLWKPELSILPTQRVYNVGDTLRVTAVVDDQLYDHRARVTFDAPDHPFYPFTALVQVQGATARDGLTDGQVRVLVDSVYEARLASAPIGPIGIGMTYVRPSADFTYRQVVYDYVLNQPGMYLMTNIDRADDARDYEAPELYEYDFPCKTYLNRRDVYPTLSHDDHLDDYDEELQLILDDVYGGSYRTSQQLEGVRTALRREAAFAFEVR